MKNKYLIHIIIISFTVFLVQIFIGAKYSFSADPLVKAVQIESFKRNNFKSQDIQYPGKNYDQEFNIHPFHEGFIFKSKDIFIGQYPIAFSFLNSFIPLEIEFLPFMNGILIFVLLLFLNIIDKKREISIFSYYFLIFGSIFITLILDLSEYPIFITLSGIGFFLIYFSWEKNDWRMSITGYLLLGLSVWFRLESIIFVSCVFIFSLYFNYLKYNNLISRNILLGGIVFGIIVFIFFFFNYILYSHALGPRYILNVSNSSLSLLERGKLFLSIVFTYPKFGIPSTGFLFISPIFMYLLIYYLKNWKTSSNSHRALVGLTICYLILTGFLAPNDGITITGRYAILAVFPLTILFNHYSNINKKSLFFYLTIIWSTLVIIFIIIVFHLSFKNLKKVNRYFEDLKGDAFVTSNEMISGSFGLKILDFPVYAIRKEERVSNLYSLLQSNDIKTFYFISYNEKFTSFNGSFNLNQEKSLHETTLNFIKKHAFTCKEIETYNYFKISLCRK